MKVNKENVPNLVKLAEERLSSIKLSIIGVYREVKEKKEAYEQAVQKREKLENEIEELTSFLGIEMDTREKQLVKKKYA